MSPFPMPSGKALGSVRISLTSAPVVTSPAAVFLEAAEVLGLEKLDDHSGVYSAMHHDYTFLWWIEGAPLEVFSAPANMPPAWNNPNVTFGQKASFCLTHPGTYLISVMVVDDSQNYATGFVEVTVKDTDGQYPGPQTLCYSATGDFTEAPAGSHRLTEWADVAARLSRSRRPTRLLFRAGEHFEGVRWSSRDGRLDHIGSFGRGARPTITPSKFDMRNIFRWSRRGPERQITIAGISFRGHWNPETETGTLAGDSIFNWRDKEKSATILVYRCDFSNHHNVQASANKAPCDIMFCDTAITNWQNFGIFAAGNSDGRYAFLGLQVAQSADALNGGPKAGLANAHGPIRVTNCRWIVGDVCDLFSNNGWSGSFDCQPCLRIGTGQENTLGIGLHWGRSVMENGYQVINLEGENRAALDSPGNFVFDRLVVLGTSMNLRKMISHHKGGATYRNIFAYNPDTPRYRGNGPTAVFSFAANNHDSGNRLSPVRVHNVTSIIEGNREEARFVEGAEEFVEVIVENNLVLHKREAVSQIDLSADLQGVVPRFSGVQYNFEHIRGKLGGPVEENGGKLFVPYESIRIKSHTGDGSGSKTNRAYWLATQKLDKLHAISVDRKVFHAQSGAISVTFDQAGATVINRSGELWQAGARYFLSLDRKSRLAVDLPRQKQFASPKRVPLAIADTKRHSEDSGQTVFLDAFGNLSEGRSGWIQTI